MSCYVITEEDAKNFLSEELLDELRANCKPITLNKLRVAKSVRIAMFNQDEMTTTQFAEMYDCSYTFAALIRKNGTDSISVIRKIAAVFDLDTMSFLKLGY